MNEVECNLIFHMTKDEIGGGVRSQGDTCAEVGEGGTEVLDGLHPPARTVFLRVDCVSTLSPSAEREVRSAAGGSASRQPEEMRRYLVFTDDDRDKRHSC